MSESVSQGEPEENIPLTERLVGTAFSLYDRRSGLDMIVTKAVDITDMTARINPAKGPILLCYGEDSAGVFVQYRESCLDGSTGLTWHFPLGQIKGNRLVQSRYQDEVLPEHRTKIIDLIIENAPVPTGGPIGIVPNISSKHLDMPRELSEF
jgi:hypothetical protein